MTRRGVAVQLRVQRLGHCRRFYTAGEDFALRHVPSVELSVIVLFRPHCCALQRYSGEDTIGAGVSEDLGTHRRIRVGFSRTSHRAGHYTGVAAHSELVAGELVHAALVHDQHDDVGFTGADLKADASAFNSNEGRRAPAVAGTAGHYTFSVLSSNYKAGALEIWNDGNTLSLVQEVRRNAFVFRSHDVTEDIRGLRDPLLCGRFASGHQAAGSNERQKTNAIFHNLSLLFRIGRPRRAARCAPSTSEQSE